MKVLAALLTPAIAILAVAVAWGQWWIARQRLSMDLFDRRFQVFMDVRRVASEAQQMGKITNPHSINEIIARARFLFGDDVFERLKTLHALAGQLETGDPAAAAKISVLFDDLVPLFAPYMRMDQKLPRRLFCA